MPTTEDIFSSNSPHTEILACAYYQKVLYVLCVNLFVTPSINNDINSNNNIHLYSTRITTGGIKHKTHP